MSSRDDRALRQSIVTACREMTAAGINQGTSGNISVRVEDGILLTPSGLAYDQMTPEDIVFMDWDGGWTAREGNVPSTEWRFHLDILKAKPEAGAVVHAHPTYCTTLAIMHRGIPAIHYMIALAGTDEIPCADYATYGSAELAQNVLAALGRGDACLMANHGMVALGRSLDAALRLAAEIETLAGQYWHACAIGTPHILPPDEVTVRDGRSQDPHVLRAIARAWNWRRQLETGAATTIQDIAASEKVSDRFLSRMMRLAYLSPEVLDHLVIRRVPPALSLNDLAAVADQPERAPGEVGTVDLVDHHFGVEAFGMRLHALHQGRAHQAVGVARPVVDFGGGHQLAADRHAGHDDGLEVGAGGVDGGRPPGGAGTEDEQAAMLRGGHRHDRYTCNRMERAGPLV